VSLRSEIADQPEVLSGMLDTEGAATAAELALAFRRDDVLYVVIAARGSSDNAARYAQYLWGARNRLTVALAAPSLFTTYARPPSLDGALVAAISQSGRSPDLVSVLKEGRAQGRPTVAITNDPNSPLADAAEFVFPLRAGPERAVAATKTYTAQLMAVAMLSAAIAGDWQMGSALKGVPRLVEATLTGSDTLEETALAFAEVDRCAVLGRGYNLSTAFEWALKLQELCYVGAQPFSTVDFEHGPIAMVEIGFPVFAILPPGPLEAEVEGLLTVLSKERGAELLVIATPGGPPGRQRIDLPDDTEDWVSPIVAAAGAQLFTYQLATARGLDPDAPRALHKVTRTW